MEGVFRLPAMGNRIHQRPDDLVKLYDRPGPAMGDEQRARGGLLAAHMNEVNVQAFQFDQTLIEPVVVSLPCAPVIVIAPVVR